MIHNNTRYIKDDVIVQAVSSNQLKVMIVVLLTALAFFAAAGLNVLASDYTSIVEGEVKICRQYLGKSRSLGIADNGLERCGVQQPYIIGKSLQHVKDETLELQKMITTQEDQQREIRRDLMDQQKNLFDELSSLGINSTLIVPNRSEALSVQVNQLQIQVTSMQQTYDQARKDVDYQIRLYKYYLYVLNKPDILNVAELIGNATNSDPATVNTQYNAIKNQNSLWQTQGQQVDNAYLAYPILSPQEFVAVADSVEWHKPSDQKVYLPITGFEAIDTEIVDSAWERGYRPRSRQDESKLISTDAQQSLPSEVSQSWLALKSEAAKQGISLTLTSGYRSPDTQKELFVGRLKENAFAVLGRELNAGDAGTSTGQQVIDKTLSLTAPPGYSKHQTGHTIDVGYQFGSNQKTTVFEFSPGYKWLSDNNYYNAKRFGFLPSYPKGALLTGPEPESWEYVWVGTM